ncbi:DUF1800 domain-containing protein [Tenacibaculum agarivorans]|uniref:DUF1800 domain-containing protein n=1 Tax=Tenacibaculum agarivorans TaxID=1908389 RepID=UPI00094BA116|nr:DUF1800 domain-containing protein [Tenacibaculum agarivorans]
MKTKHILHLYNRIGFGIHPKKLATLKDLSKEQIVNNLFKESNHFSPLQIDTSFMNGIHKDNFKSMRKELVKKSRIKIKDYNYAWIHRLKNPSEVLREKMTLFWTNHFVCEDNNILYVQQYNNTLRKHALGNFGEFIKAISKEAAMLKYLNNKQNKKRSPNENFARELMELFMLGQGNYTEKDIKESARSFAGYNHDFKGNFKLRKKHQDLGIKTFFGNTGNFNGDDIIDIILKEKQCAKFICEKIYRYFVNDTVNESHIQQMTTVFYPDYNIKKLMKSILLSNWFYEEQNIGCKIKSPIELLIGIHTVVPYTFQKPKQLLLVQRLLGQTLLKPPNVAGWKQGKGWIDSNTIVTRLRLPSVLLNNAEINYSEKGDFKDVITNFRKKKLKRKAFIKTTPNWNSFDKNYEPLSYDELLNFIIVSPINKGTKVLLENYKSYTKKDFCIQLLSLPEYQLC